jgi:Smg protein
VDLAFSWLESLNQPHQKNCRSQGFRIFTAAEKQQLDLECRGFLISLELSGILSADYREIVIDLAMVLEDENIYLEELKWIVLLVLLTQSDDDTAYSRMENIVYDLSPIYLH